jgi:hypothetical protein
MAARGTIYNDFTGRKIGRWIVKGYAGRSRHRRSLWKCICECGQVRIISDANLRSGRSKSCGCLKSDLKTESSVRSGRSTARGIRSPEYQSWSSMIARVSTKQLDRRGLDYALITVCQRWRRFENFLADMGKRPPGTSIERKNNDVGYCKRNCKWGTPSEQIRNRRSSEQVASDRAAALKRAERKK